MIYKLLISVCLVCLVAFLTLAQVRNANLETRKSVHIDEKKPAVYLEFVKLGKRNFPKPCPSSSSENPCPRETEELETVWLRVHNNSRWAIQFRVLSESLSTDNSELKPLPDKRLVITPTKKSELELVYGVEPVNPEVPVKANLTKALPYTRIYWSITDVWLPSGESVVFVVRREELRRNLQVFLPFKYEWETSEKNRGYGEPEHRVYFTWDKFENAAGL